MRTLLFILAVSFISCSGEKKEKPAPGEYGSASTGTGKQEQGKKEAPVCFIFCDFTKSMGSAASDQIVIRHAKNIVDHYKSNHTFYIYPIGNNQNISFLFQYENKIGSTVTPSEKKKREQLQKRLPDSVEAILINAALNKPPSTCILQSLEAMQAKLHNLSLKTSPSVKIFILSDMLEACTTRSQAINLQNTKSFSGAMAALDKMPPPSLSFSNHTNALIYPVITSHAALDFDRLRAFWNKAFHKYGYDTMRLPALSTDISFPWFDKQNN